MEKKKMEDKIIIFGVGQNGKGAYDYLKDKVNVIAFSDNQETKWGKIVLEGIQCIAPIDIPKDVTVIIATGRHHWKILSEQMEMLEIKYQFFDQYVLLENESRLKNIENLFADEFSKKVYRELIKYRASADGSIEESSISENIYFPLAQFRGTFCKKETFIDIGAYVGDVIEKYISYHLDYFKKIYAFEPGKKQYNALCRRMRRIEEEWALDKGQIICENAALSNKNGFIKLCDSVAPSGSYISDSVNMIRQNEEEVPVYKLDDYLDEEIDYIKMDVEGEELNVLKGAENLIKKYHPLMAISIYHHPYDFYEIPEYIMKMFPEYKIIMRHYTGTYLDTVLYCYI